MQLSEPGSSIYGSISERLPALNFTLFSYFSSWKYFFNVEEQLRLDFTFKSEVLDRAKQFMDAATPPEWKERDFLKVVIHVRRQDRNTEKQRKRGWADQEPDYFNRSMAYYNACHPRVLFIVLSDDIQWCRRYIVGDHIVYSIGNTPTGDMAIAFLCDHAIITKGTYGWWVAWFAGGVTVTQKNIPTPKSILASQLRRKDFYKPRWVAL